jgi:hypothetical protein
MASFFLVWDEEAIELEKLRVDPATLQRISTASALSSLEVSFGSCMCSR